MTDLSEQAASGPIRVALIDDHLMFAESLARLIGDEPDITIVGTFDGGSEALRGLGRHEADVVLVAYHLPDVDGVEVSAEIKRRWPETMVVMLTGSTEDHVLVAAIEAGCSGLVTKDRPAADVTDAIRRAAAGEALLSPEQLARLLPLLARTSGSAGIDLTARELEILTAIAGGKTNRVVAAELNLSVNTVRNYVQSVLLKLGAHSKLEAVSTAVRQGILDYPAR